MDLMLLKEILLVIIFIPLVCFGKDKSFDGITCQSNIRSEFLERSMPFIGEPALKAKYKNINLEYHGADDGGTYGLTFWKICGKEYIFLEDKLKSIVLDVLKSPVESNEIRSRFASCVVEGKKVDEETIIFSSTASANNPIKTELAWKIDEINFKFIRIESNEILCQLYY